MQQVKQNERQLTNAQDQDMYDLLRDLEQRKEKELRAQIEKEEILHNIKDMDQK